MNFLRFISIGLGCAVLAGCGAGVQTSAGAPSTLAQVGVVNQLPMDSNLFGHNMFVSGCMAYVTMQNNFATSKLAVVNLCGTGTSVGTAPVLLSKTAGSYAAMNGITQAGKYLYVTYAWATNPFEVWSVGDGTTAPAKVSCVPLYTDPPLGYTSCGSTASGYGALLGSAPYVVGNYAYVAENSDDSEQAVQVADVTNPAAPVKVAYPAGVTAGVSTGGQMLAGIWVAGVGSTLYVATVDTIDAADQPVTITAYNAAANAINPVQVGAALQVPMGYAVQNISVTGTTLVATLFNGTTSVWKVMVASFANAAAPTYVLVDPTKGCGFESQNFIALQNGYAFMGCGMDKGIEVVQLKNPAAPVVMGEIGTSLVGVGYISPQGRYLYAVDMNGNLDTIDGGSVFE
jgi:hypothetical protein